MKTRIISGALVAIIAFVMAWLGGPVLATFLCFVSIVAYMEISDAMQVRFDNKISGLQAISVGFIVAYYGIVYFFDIPLYGHLCFGMLLYALLLIVHMFVYVVTYPKYDTDRITRSFLAFGYGPVMLSFILLTRSLTNSLDLTNYNFGFFAAWMIFISAWGSDTCAYFVGVLVGKHKIFPVLSPKKTVEGCLGGVLGASLFGVIYGYILFKNGVVPLMFVCAFGILGALGSVVGQIGDLAASAIKRHFKIKDYGKIIPGHGGIMDRFDSVIFTAPLAYTICVIFQMFLPAIESVIK